MRKLILLSLLLLINSCSFGTTNPYFKLNISYDRGILYTESDCNWKEWAFENDDQRQTLDQLYETWKNFYPEIAKIHSERESFFKSLSNEEKMIFIEIDQKMKERIDCFNFLD